MKKQIFTAALAFVFAAADAQILLPFLGKNGLTGLADESGKLVVEPQFTELDYLVEAEKASFYAKKNGERLLVLRNGMQFPARDGANLAFFVRNFDAAETSATDTLRHLIAIEMRDNIVYADTRTGKKVEFPREPGNGLRGWFPVDLHAQMGGFGNPFAKFRFGCARVNRAGGMLNFLDTSLNLIFREDFAAATVVDAQFFIVANAEKKFAIADRTGRIRSKFQSEWLVPTPKTGFFISNPPIMGYTPTKKGNVGLMDADGNFILKPKFDDIRLGGEQFLIIKTSAGEGLADYAGNTVLPPAEGELEHVFGDFFTRKKGRKKAIVNSKGEAQLPGEFDELLFMPSNGGRHFRFTDGPTCGAFSDDFRLIFRDTCGFAQAVVFEKKVVFKSHKSRSASGNLVGLVSFSGKELLPREFLSIESAHETGILVVKKGGFAGLFSFNGRWILPCEFEEALAFNHREVLPDGTMGKKTLKIFGKKQGANRWQAFDSDGKRLPENDCFHPMNNKSDKLIYSPPNQRGENRKVLFADGSAVEMPTSWLVAGSFKAAETPAGLMILHTTLVGDWEVLDKNLNSLLPPGFWIPREEFNARNFENIGLAPVWQKNPNEKRMPPPEIVAEKPVKKDNPIRLVEEDPPPMVDVVVEEKMDQMAVLTEQSTLGPIGCGVMNGRGEWVIKATENARFQPISWNLVVEYALSGTEDHRSKPRKLHRVNHPKPAVFDIVGADGLDGDGRILVYQNVDDPAEPGRKVPLQAWFSRDGEQLSPCHFSLGKTHFKNRCAVRLHENGKKRWVIINEKAQKVADLGDLDDTGAYFLENGFLAASKSGKWGLLDSTGREVLPFNFQKLSIVESGRFLQERVETGNKYRLLDWKGVFLAESGSPIERRSTDANGSLIVLNYRTLGANSTAETLIFSNDGVKIGEVHGLFYSNVFMAEKGRFGQFLASDGKKFLVDLKTGREFREK